MQEYITCRPGILGRPTNVANLAAILNPNRPNSRPTSLRIPRQSTIEGGIALRCSALKVTDLSFGKMVAEWIAIFGQQCKPQPV